MNRWTRQRIVDAFVRLVVRYGYDQISIQMLLREADVSKTTFYRYFRDKADVMDTRFRMIYDQALEDQSCCSLRDLFTILLRQAREHPDQLAMFATTGYNAYREFIYRYTYTMGKEIVETAWGRTMSEQECFHIAFFCGGGSRILEQWSQGKVYQQMSSEEAADQICNMVNDRYLVQLNEGVMTHMRRLVRREHNGE